MKRVAKLDKNTARRGKVLGDNGEKLTEILLESNGFTNILNLNHQKKNFAYADFYGERNDEKYVISVKTRNKYEFTHDGSKRLNSRYKLGDKCYENAKKAEDLFDAKAAWIAIAVEEKTYSAYFGLLSSLKGKGIPMTEKAKSSYECLACDEFHNYDYTSIQNTYEKHNKLDS